MVTPETTPAKERCQAERVEGKTHHWCTQDAGHEQEGMPHISGVTGRPFTDRERCPTCKRTFPADFDISKVGGPGL